MQKVDLRNFDYLKVARYDADMWRSYYNHQFLKLFYQLLLLTKSQLGLSWPITIRLAYYAGWAAADYRINKTRGTYERPLKNVTKFYQIVSKHSLRPYDYQKVAELELEWWEIHRFPERHKKTLESSLADYVSAIYGVSTSQVATYAHNRAEAMLLPRHEGDSQAQQVDWPRVNKLLLEGWKSLHNALHV